MQQQIFDILFNKDEITWKSIIYDLVQSEEMDPWDVDVSLIAHQFLEKLKTLKKMDLRVSGKVLLASAILLKIKSKRLMEEDLDALDMLIASTEGVEEDQFYDELLDVDHAFHAVAEEKPMLYPRCPQPRKRKLSVFDLVDALEKALEVKHRRKEFKSSQPKVKVPEKGMDISLVIRDIYKQIRTYFKSSNDKKLTFNFLLPSEKKGDKIYTFIPLLHLDYQRKINLLQERYLGEIEIELVKISQ